jgi:hypothetical protein
MCRRDVLFTEAFFFEAPFASALFEAAFADPAGCFRCVDLVVDVGFARAPLGVPAPGGAAAFGLRRLRRRLRRGGSSESAGMSSPAMTCG